MDVTSMNVLITGASGFIGQHLIEHFANNRSRSRRIHATGLHSQTSKLAHYHRVDLTQATRVDRLIRKIRPAELYHLVGISTINAKLGMQDYFKVNFLTTLHLLRALEKYQIPCKIFFASSMHVYGNQEGMIDEKAELRPQTYYAFTKMIAEEAIRAFTVKNKCLSALVGRLYSCFGPGQREGFVTADLCKKISKLPKNGSGGILKVGPLATRRRFLDVRDVVRVIDTLMHAKLPSRYEVINIASPHELEIRELVKLLLRLSGKSPKVESAEDTSNQFRGLRMKLDKLESLVPGKMFRPVEETLRDMLAGRQNGH